MALKVTLLAQMFPITGPEVLWGDPRRFYQETGNFAR